MYRKKLELFYEKFTAFLCCTLYHQEDGKFYFNDYVSQDHKKNQNKSIVFTGYSGFGNQKISFDLENIPDNVDVIPIFAKTYISNNSIHLLGCVRGLSLKILDEIDQFELFNCTPPEKDSVIIIAVFMRNKWKKWNLYSCMKSDFIFPFKADDFVYNYINDPALVPSLLEMDQI